MRKTSGNNSPHAKMEGERAQVETWIWSEMPFASSFLRIVVEALQTEGSRQIPLAPAKLVTAGLQDATVSLLCEVKAQLVG